LLHYLLQGAEVSARLQRRETARLALAVLLPRLASHLLLRLLAPAQSGLGALHPQQLPLLLDRMLSALHVASLLLDLAVSWMQAAAQLL